MLAQVLRRLRACRRLDGILVATTTAAADDVIVSLAREERVECLRGSEDDVLGRYADAARASSADVVVRITADCPLIDAGVVDTVVDALESGECDYASNVIQRTYPRGLDVEALFRDALERVDRLGRSRQAREHVTWFVLHERPDLFVSRSITDLEDHSALRWTVDTAEDLAFVRRLYDELGLNTRTVPYADTLHYVLAHPDLSAINAAVQQKAG